MLNVLKTERDILLLETVPNHTRILSIGLWVDCPSILVDPTGCHFLTRLSKDVLLYVPTPRLPYNV